MPSNSSNIRCPMPRLHQTLRSGGARAQIRRHRSARQLRHGRAVGPRGAPANPGSAPQHHESQPAVNPPRTASIEHDHRSAQHEPHIGTEGEQHERRRRADVRRRTLSAGTRGELQNGGSCEPASTASPS